MGLASVLAVALLATAASQPTIPLSGPPPSPARLPPLASGEVLAEMRGAGFVRTPATHVVLTLHPVGAGPTATEAQRALAAKVERLTAQLRGQGVAPADIASRPTPRVNVDLRTFDVVDSASPDGDVPVPEPHEAHETLIVTIRDPARLAEVQSALAGEFAITVRTGPRYELADDTGPRLEARRLAMARARADAEAYAAALGMRVARVLRVTERSGFDVGGMMLMEQIESERRASGATDPRLVETGVIVGVDYALAPL